tara:strand:- start:5575 stop:6774 length:1200 start_codon:yes stop_codon:yes gene_type:complete
MELKERILQLAEANFEKVVNIRRHLHAHPELSFEEQQTAEFIKRELEKMGLEYETGYAKNGIVGTLSGTNKSKAITALRADIDALPIHEANNVHYCSTNDGVMHACGHDVHTSSLLGTLMILKELQSELKGTVKFLFQPGEEVLPGGASIMIKDGALRNPEPNTIFGQHVYPDLEVGKVGFRPGMYMASCDEIYITVKGKGGHAALPHKLVDPVLISAHLITALQQIVSRNALSDIPSVLSFGKIEAKGATNIIPNEVKIAGTFRTMNERWRDDAHRRIKKLTVELCQSMGGDVEIDIKKGYPYLENNPELTNAAKDWAIELLGEENVIDLDLRMTAEDFSYYSQKMPACFYRLGTRNDSKGINSGLHTPTFDVDEQALKTGPALMAWLTIKELQNQNQ